MSRPALFFSAALLLLPAQALGEERRIQLEMQGSAAYDALYIGGLGAAIATGSFVLTPRLSDVAPLDGLGHRGRHRGFDSASDLTLAGGLVTGVALGAALEAGSGSSGWDVIRAPLVLTEGALAASAVIQLAKNIVGACRPRDWDDSARVCTTGGESSSDEHERRLEAHRSFPSGHTAPLAGMAGAAFGMWLLPTSSDRTFLPLAVTQGAFAVAMVGLRPAAGAHSWVDTGTAFVVGAAMGLLSASLHTTRGSDAAPGAAAAPAPTQVSFGGSF